MLLLVARIVRSFLLLGRCNMCFNFLFMIYLNGVVT